VKFGVIAKVGEPVTVGVPVKLTVCGEFEELPETVSVAEAVVVLEPCT
jgi:hypothetical protein